MNTTILIIRRKFLGTLEPKYVTSNQIEKAKSIFRIPGSLLIVLIIPLLYSRLSFSGDELPMDVCSVWHDEQFMKYSISLMAYGYFGDIIKESEKLRWVGPKRYDLAGIKRFMVNKLVH